MIEFKVPEGENGDAVRPHGDYVIVTDTGSVENRATASIAVLVMKAGSANVLCPFFGKCDGVLLLDRTGQHKSFLSNEGESTKSICDLILQSGTKCVVCGFIGEGEKKKLSANGVDVRLGSCACSVEELARNFHGLERA